MEPRRIVKFIYCFLFAFSAGLAGADDFPRIAPRDEMFEIRAEKGDFSGESYIRHSLFLSDLPESEQATYIDRYNTLVGRFTRQMEEENITSPYQLGEEILIFLHENLFDRYRELQTHVPVVFDSGVYNCVSSAVVYSAFALEMELPVRAVNAVDHVFCSVVTEEGSVDVETTSRYGFHPGIKREFTDSFGKTGFTYVPPGNYRHRSTEDLLALLSYILQNRIAELQKRQRYNESVPLAVDRYALLGNSTAFDEMVSEFINYAAALNKAGSYTEGIAFLRYTGGRYSVGSSFDEIYATLTNNRIIELARAGNFQEGLDEVSDWRREVIISASDAEQLYAILYDREAYYAVNNLPHDEALSLITRRYRQGYLPEGRYREFVIFLYGKRAEAEGRKGNWLEAAALLEEAEKLTGASSQLSRGIEAYRKNYAVTVHNRFADLFNSGAYREAYQLVLDALKEVPESSVLKKDLRTAESALDDN